MLDHTHTHTHSSVHKIQQKKQCFSLSCIRAHGNGMGRCDEREQSISSSGLFIRVKHHPLAAAAAVRWSTAPDFSAEPNVSGSQTGFKEVSTPKFACRAQTRPGRLTKPSPRRLPPYTASTARTSPPLHHNGRCLIALELCVHDFHLEGIIKIQTSTWSFYAPVDGWQEKRLAASFVLYRQL